MEISRINANIADSTIKRVEAKKVEKPELKEKKDLVSIGSGASLGRKYFF